MTKSIVLLMASLVFKEMVFFGVVNKEGVEIMPCKYRKATEFKGGRIWVLDGGQYYILNENGKEFLLRPFLI